VFTSSVLPSPPRPPSWAAISSPVRAPREAKTRCQPVGAPNELRSPGSKPFRGASRCVRALVSPRCQGEPTRRQVERWRGPRGCPAARRPCAAPDRNSAAPPDRRSGRARGRDQRRVVQPEPPAPSTLVLVSPRAPGGPVRGQGTVLQVPALPPLAEQHFGKLAAGRRREFE
jgi:hypothetical protein